VQAMRPSAAGGARRIAPGETSADLQLVVPRLAGAALERGDRSHVPPGFALLRLDGHGLQLLTSAEQSR
jgi:hypothetical protein